MLSVMEILKSLRRKLFGSKLPDLSRSYADPTIAVRQRQIVDQQLQMMRNDNAPEHFKVVGRILSQINEDTDSDRIALLDAGCASAYHSEIVDFFVPRWVEYVGVDFNPGMLDLAKNRYPALPLARMDLRNLAFCGRSFDLVMSGAVVVHIKEWKDVVRELTRITRRWVFLHRTVVYTGSNASSIAVERHYDKDVYRVRVSEDELLALTSDLGLTLAIKCDAGEGRFPEGQENNSYLFERKGS